MKKFDQVRIITMHLVQIHIVIELNEVHVNLQFYCRIVRGTTVQAQRRCSMSKHVLLQDRVKRKIWVIVSALVQQRNGAPAAIPKDRGNYVKN